MNRPYKWRGKASCLLRPKSSSPVWYLAEPDVAFGQPRTDVLVRDRGQAQRCSTRIKPSLQCTFWRNIVDHVLLALRVMGITIDPRSAHRDASSFLAILRHRSNLDGLHHDWDW